MFAQEGDADDRRRHQRHPNDMGRKPPKDKRKRMSDNQTKPSDMADLLAFYRRGNTADILQAREGKGWGAAWTFAPCDVHAAEKAAWMICGCTQAPSPPSVTLGVRGSMIGIGRPQTWWW